MKSNNHKEKSTKTYPLTVWHIVKLKVINPRKRDHTHWFLNDMLIIKPKSMPLQTHFTSLTNI